MSKGWVGARACVLAGESGLVDCPAATLGASRAAPCGHRRIPGCCPAPQGSVHNCPPVRLAHLSMCRGAPLSGGWVAQAGGHDCVVCPYHGWAFDAEGRLRDVPVRRGHMISVRPGTDLGSGCMVWVLRA